MRRVVLALAVLTVLGGAQPASPQPSEDLKNLRKEVDALREGQKAMLGDLQEIKKLLQARPTAAAPPPPPTNVVLNVEGAPFLGEKNAKVTIIEFTDYQ